jgi:hypothetical protein
MPRRPAEYLHVRDGELGQVERNGKVRPQEYTAEERNKFHAELAWIARERGYRPGWAAYKYKERFGSWPADRFVVPRRPSPEVLAWDRHCRIKFAKSIAAQASAADG